MNRRGEDVAQTLGENKDFAQGLVLPLAFTCRIMRVFQPPIYPALPKRASYIDFPPTTREVPSMYNTSLDSSRTADHMIHGKGKRFVAVEIAALPAP